MVNRGAVVEPDVTLTAVPAGVTSLKNGDVSITFHVPNPIADRAFGLHDLRDKMVKVDVYLMPED